MIVSITLTVFVYATQAVAGWLVWSRFDDAPDRAVAPTLARVLLIGPAVIAVQMLLYSALGLPFDLLGITLPWWGAWLWRMRGGLHLPSAKHRARDHIPWRLVAYLVIAVQTALVLVVATSAPVHISDAMHNFAMPAKVLALHGGLSIDSFAELTDPGNVHYPPLVPFNEALFFLVDPHDGAWLVQPFFALGFLAWALLVMESVWASHRPIASTAVVAIILATPEPVANAVHGLADLRVMAALLLVMLEARRLAGDPSRGVAHLALAAIAAGLAKREGYVIAVCACAFLAWNARGRAAGAPRAMAWSWALAAGALVASWPLFARLSGLTAIPAEFQPAVTPAAVIGALDRIPAVATGMIGSMVDDDVEGLSRWGVFWLGGVLWGGWRALWGRCRSAWLWFSWWFGHLWIAAWAVAVIEVSLCVRTEWVLRATAERLVLLQMVWVVLLASPATTASSRTP